MSAPGGGEAKAPPQKSIPIFARVGGWAGLTAAVERFYDRLVTDPLLASYFEGIDRARLHAKQVKFMGFVFGGAPLFFGQTLDNAHRTMIERRGLGLEHFERLKHHFKSSLEDGGVNAQVIAEALAVLDTTRPHFDPANYPKALLNRKLQQARASAPASTSAGSAAQPAATTAGAYSNTTPPPLSSEPDTPMSPATILPPPQPSAAPRCPFSGAPAPAPQPPAPASPSPHASPSTAAQLPAGTAISSSAPSSSPYDDIEQDRPSNSTQAGASSIATSCVSRTVKISALAKMLAPAVRRAQDTATSEDGPQLSGSSGTSSKPRSAKSTRETKLALLQELLENQLAAAQARKKQHQEREQLHQQQLLQQQHQLQQQGRDPGDELLDSDDGASSDDSWSSFCPDSDEEEEMGVLGHGMQGLGMQDSGDVTPTLGGGHTPRDEPGTPRRQASLTQLIQPAQASAQVPGAHVPGSALSPVIECSTELPALQPSTKQLQQLQQHQQHQGGSSASAPASSIGSVREGGHRRRHGPIHEQTKEEIKHTTLYEKLGSRRSIMACVQIFYARILMDNDLAPFFDGVDVDQLVHKQAAFFTFAFGGAGDGQEMNQQQLAARHAHLVRERGLTQFHFDKMCSHFVESLQSIHVSQEHIDEATLVLLGVRPLFDPQRILEAEEAELAAALG